MADADEDILIDFNPNVAASATLPVTELKNVRHAPRAASAMVSVGMGLMILSACQAYFVASGEYVHTGRMMISNPSDQIMLGAMLIPAILFWFFAIFAKRHHLWAIAGGGAIAVLCIIGCGAFAIRQLRFAIRAEAQNPFVLIQVGAFGVLALAMLLVLLKCVRLQAWINHETMLRELQARAAYQQQMQQYYAYPQQPIPPPQV